MSREEQVATRLRADATLASLSPGGIFSSGQLGIEGLSRTATPDAFVDGLLRTTTLVRGRAIVPFGDVRDLKAQHASVSQQVEIWTYSESSADIDAAQERLYALLEGHAFPNAWPAAWTFTLAQLRDEGGLSGAFVSRMDYQILSVRSAVVVL